MSASEARDDEYSSPSLRYAEKSGIEDAVSDSSPELPKPPENRSKISSSVRAEQSGDVFENNEGWIAPVRRFTHLPHDPDDFPVQSAALALQAGALTRDGEILAGESPDHDINGG
jgi:hypothetical protein